MSQNVPPRPGLPRNNSYSSCTSTVELISDGTISWTLASLFKIPPPQISVKLQETRPQEPSSLC